MTESGPRMLVLGAHPDDAEFHAGGLIARYRRLGYTVRIISVTNGCSGHHQRQPEELARVRRAETEAVARLTGVEYEVWDFADARLLPSLDVREAVIRAIRQFVPDLVLTHRTCDYHPDHRAVGQAVQDASYLVTVPLVAPDQPALRSDPVVAYMTDFFTRPNPLRPDVVLDVGAEFEMIVDMLACHASQVFEWLPYNKGVADEVPRGEAERRLWLRDWFRGRAVQAAEHFRDALREKYGTERGDFVQYAEAYEISEYASGLNAEARQRLFPESSAPSDASDV